VRALLFSNLFPTSADPNRGLFTRQLAAEINRLCPLDVAVPLAWFPANPIAARLAPAYARDFGALAPELDFDGIRAIYPRYPLIPRVSERFHDRLMYWGVKRKISALHRSQRFDLINAHWLYPDGVVAARLGAHLGIPVVLTALGCDVNDELEDPVKRAHVLAATRAAAAVTAVSQTLADRLEAVGVPREKLHVIPNGVDTIRFAPSDRDASRRELGLSDAPLVVCVSRLSHEKGVDILVDAARALHSRAPAARVAIVGNGTEHAALERQIKAAGLSDVVRLVGAVRHEAVPRWMSAADVVCMPSRREGHPNAAMEALACGRPLVASRAGALTSLVTAARGITVEPGDSAALGEALAVALTHSWDAAAIAGSVRDDSWARAAQGYVRVYREAIGAAVPETTGNIISI
jgi:glycosyltransferase involved in cell wall biosynthesis